MLVGAFVRAHGVAYGGDLFDLAIHGEIHRQVFRAVVECFFGVSKIAVERDAIDFVIALFEHGAVPLNIGGHEGAARSAGDELDGGIENAHLPGGVRGFDSVFAGWHVADLPRAVHLITDAPVLHVVRLIVSVRAAQFAPFGSAGHIAVFDQGGRIFRRRRAKVEPEERFGAHGACPRDEFVGAELVGLQRVPCTVEDGGPVLFRAHSIEPVIARNEIAAGVANDGHSQVVNFLDHVGAESIAVSEFRTGIIDSFVDGAAEMLKKRAEEMRIDGRNLSAWNR